MHPFEDFAETWAHYLHMTDALSAAEQFGIDPDSLDIGTDPFVLDNLADSPCHTDDGPDPEAFLETVNQWVRLSSVLNVLTRSMGQPDSYPFVLTLATLRKMYFVHRLIN